MVELELTDPTTFQALAPMLILIGTALVAFLIDSIDPDSTNYDLVAFTSIAGTVAALGVAVWYVAVGVGDPSREQQDVYYLLENTLVVDQTALFFTVLVTSVTALVLLASHDYLEDQPHAGEFYSLVVLAATGMVTMGMSNSLVTAFIALELSSLPSYALVAFLKDNRGSVEAGLKYFLIGALSSAILVYGISLVYVSTGRLLLTDVAAAVTEGVFNEGILAVGILMILGGLAFKMASVPFQFWAPEAYEGAPAPISGFLSSASKAAGFVLAFRVFIEAFPIEAVSAGSTGVDWVIVFQVLAVVTMVVGNFAAAVQDNVKRMLAYSSIGHAGYVLIGLAALTSSGTYNDWVLGGAMLHLFVYGFMNTGAFLFIALAEHWEVGRTFEDYNGLATQAPVASLAMTVFLFNLAGLPIGAGFLSKYLLFGAAVGNGIWWLAAVGAVTSTLSLYYYSRLAKAMWIEDPAEDLVIDSQPVGLYTAVIAAAVVTVALLVVANTPVSTAVDAASALLA
jgi:NADH-quinone oxidoreductase subunit N